MHGREIGTWWAVLALLIFVVASCGPNGSPAGESSSAPRLFGPEQTGWFCPWCKKDEGTGFSMTPRGYDQGPGTVPRGPGMGPGEIVGRRKSGPGLGSDLRTQENRGAWTSEKRGMGDLPPGITLPLTMTDARRLLRDYLEGEGLSIRRLRDAGEVFAAHIEDERGDLTDVILVDKSSGWFRRTYR
ncbi:MAG: hypothetical protein ACOC0U_02910 [Desulfovibrionales bacterium]